MDDRLKYALQYAEKGWRVVPDHSVTDKGLCTCSDTKCTTPGKHPRMDRDSPMAHLRREGSISSVRIEQWWHIWPDSNVAIVCGSASNLVVVDVDPRNSGFESLAQMQVKYGKLPPTLVAKSGGNGRHYYFKHPRLGFVVRNRIGLAPGIDIKADGGRIVAPPSKHKSGKLYEWVDADVPPASLPLWLLDKIQNEKGTGTRSHMQRTREPFGFSQSQNGALRWQPR